MSLLPRSNRTAILVALFAALSATAAGAQARPPQGAPSGWAPIQIGVRFGYDDRPTGSVLGAQIRIPVLPSGLIEVVPHGDLTFRSGRRERQVGVDGVLVWGRAGSALYGGGGVVRRRASYGEAGEETREGTSLAFGLRSALRGDVPVGVQVEARWVFVDGARSWRVLSLGANLPLWGWGRGR